ncbi:MAG: 16S rRNA (guanine(966)-N(2))-methyltransferase RsmD [Motiliproteus sp.]
MARRPKPSNLRRGSASKPANGQNKGTNKLRIIGGRWRGRKLEFADLPGLRPTTDRVRETLFNWLQTQIPGARCLDLFAGSGALGLEALSRGAEQVTLIDSADVVVQQLRQNLALLNNDQTVNNEQPDETEPQASVIHSQAIAWLQKTTTDSTFDLIFLDPPFGKTMLQQCCELIDQQALLNSNGWIYIEAESTLQPLPVPAHWQLHRSLKAGQASCYLYQHRPLENT